MLSIWGQILQKFCPKPVDKFVDNQKKYHALLISNDKYQFAQKIGINIKINKNKYVKLIQGQKFRKMPVYLKW